MKIFTENEARDYYRSILYWGSAAGIAGLCGGALITGTLNRYYAPFRSFTPAIKGSLALYPGFLSLAAGASYGSRLFELREHPETGYIGESQRAYDLLKRRENMPQRVKEWTYEHRYLLCGGTWATTMTIALELMRRDHLMTGTQKLVQARVVAQLSTIIILLITTAMEVHDVAQGRGKFETVTIFEPDNPSHQHLAKLRLPPHPREGS